MEYKTIDIENVENLRLPGLSVYVYDVGTTDQATIYNEAEVIVTQPLVSDQYGQVSFRAANGSYDISATYSGQTRVMENVQFFDPVDSGVNGLTARQFGAVVDGVTDDTAAARLALAAAQSRGAYHISLTEGVMYAPSLAHNEYPDIKFVGDGEISGAYRRHVADITRCNLPDVAPEMFQHISRLRTANTNPTVVLVGDSIAQYSANTRVRSGMLTWAVENHFRNQFPACTFYNRAIGGQQYTHLDSVPTTFPADWYTTPATPWLDYVSALTPDVVVLSFGMNDSGNFSSNAFRSVISKIQAFTPAPDIIVCTNLNPSLDGDPDLAYSLLKDEQEDHDYCAGYLRTFCQHENIPLWDFHRLHCMVRDGFDPVYGKIGLRDTSVTLAAQPGAQEGYTGAQVCYNWAATITIDETALTTAGTDYVDFKFGGEADKSYVRVKNIAGNYALLVYNGTDVLVPEKTMNSTVALGTNTARVWSFERYGNMVHVYEGAGTDAVNRDPVFSTKVISTGGECTPTISQDSAAGILQGVVFYYDRPTRYLPTATDTELWGANDAGFDTYGGSGFNHPGSAMFTKVYWPIISKTQLYYP